MMECSKDKLWVVTEKKVVILESRLVNELGKEAPDSGEFPANSHYFMKFSLFFEILTKFSEISLSK